MKFAPLLAGFGIAAGLLSLISPSSRPASAAPDNALGMAIMSAAVGSDGSLLYGNGVKSAQRTGVGQYEVTFDRSVARCPAVAAVNTFASIVRVGVDPTPPPYVNDDKLTVLGADMTGSAKDVTFTVMAYCAR